MQIQSFLQLTSRIAWIHSSCLILAEIFGPVLGTTGCFHAYHAVSYRLLRYTIKPCTVHPALSEAIIVTFEWIGRHRGLQSIDL